MIKHINESEFESLVKENNLVLVDFFATWCGPCKMLAPTIEKLSEEYDEKVVVAKVDVDTAPSLSGAFNISSIPTVILFKNGKAIEQIVGLTDINNYKSMIDKNL